MFFNVLQIIVYFIIVIGLSIPLGLYMKKVYSHEHTFMSRIVKPIENFIYRF